MNERAGRKKRLVIGAVGLLWLAGSASADQAFLNRGDRFCPQDTRLVSSALARENKAELCNLLKDWDIARLAGNASLSGPGRNCEIYEAIGVISPARLEELVLLLQKHLQIMVST